MAGSGMDLEDKPFWRDMPTIPDTLAWIYQAFWDISGSRSSSEAGLGRIPFEAADRYAARFGVEDFEEFWLLIKKMDDAFIRYQNERMKKP